MDRDTTANLTEVWKQYDSTCSKRVNLEQLRQIFLDLGKDVSDKELNACAKGNNNCNLDMLSEYLAAMPKLIANPDDISNNAVILSQYCGGQLRTVELRLLLTTQGDRFTNDEAAALVSDSDPHMTGFVDVEGFAQRICKTD